MDELNKNPMAGEQQVPNADAAQPVVQPVVQPASIPAEEPKKEAVPAQEIPASDIPGTTPENTPAA
jgi:hypothetical protein